MTVTARLVLFVSSYAPLLALFALLNSFGTGWPSLTLGAFAAVSVVALIVVWRLLRASTGSWVQLTSARSRDGDVMAFFTSYVVPFAAAQDSGTRTRIALAVFLVLLAALYIRSAVVYVHPLLLLVGWHVVEAITEHGVPVTLLTRRPHVRQTDRLMAVTIAPNVLMERS